MSSSLRPGALLSAAGALVLGAALWLPWYAVDVPATFGRQLGDSAQVPPLLGRLLREIAAAIPADLTVTAWQAFDFADVFLAVACAHVVFAVVWRSSGSHAATAAAKLALVAGCAAVGLVVLKLASPPGPSGVLEVRYGGWVALAGALLVALGGVLAVRDAAAPAHVAVPFPGTAAPSGPPTGDVTVPWETAGSVAPPGR